MARNLQHIKVYVDDRQKARIEIHAKDVANISASKFLLKLVTKYGPVMAAEIAHENKTGEKIEVERLLSLIEKREREIFAPLISKKSHKLI